MARRTFFALLAIFSWFFAIFSELRRFFGGHGGGRAEFSVSGRPGRPEVTGPWFGEGSGKGLATRQAGDVLMGGASGAGSLLLNTKASQEAACSRAPAAIAPGQAPELRDAGVSRFSGNGSHLEEVKAAESSAGQVDGPGSSEFSENRLTPGSGGCRRGPGRRRSSGSE